MENISDDNIEKLLFEALKKEPETALPFGFSTMVTRKIYARSVGFTTRVVALFTGILIIAVISSLMLSFYPEIVRPLFAYFISIKYIPISIVAIYLIIEFLDHKFIRKALN